MMIVIALIGVFISLIALTVVIHNARKSEIQKIIDTYVVNSPQNADEGPEVLLKSGALNFNNRSINFMCNEIVKRGIKHPFMSYEEVLQKRIFRKTLQAFAKANRRN